jgi:hypothetical protein
VGWCEHAWRGRVALLRDRRCTSGHLSLLIALVEPFILRSFLLLFTFYERATPVAQERDPTRHARPHAETCPHPPPATSH